MRWAIVLWVWLAPALVLAEGFGPWSTPSAPAMAERFAASTPVVLPHRQSTLRTSGFYVPFKFYQDVLSPIDGPRCAHRPTCSLYAIEAMRSHPLLGAFLAIDRLWRGAESSSLRLLPVVPDSEGRLHFSDPLSESDFWLP